MKIPEMSYFMLGWMCLEYLWFKPGVPLKEAGSSWKKPCRTRSEGKEVLCVGDSSSMSRSGLGKWVGCKIKETLNCFFKMIINSSKSRVRLMLQMHMGLFSHGFMDWS